jgi:hypothetical protein
MSKLVFTEKQKIQIRKMKKTTVATIILRGYFTQKISEFLSLEHTTSDPLESELKKHVKTRPATS